MEATALQPQLDVSQPASIARRLVALLIDSFFWYTISVIVWMFVGIFSIPIAVALFKFEGAMMEYVAPALLWAQTALVSVLLPAWMESSLRSTPGKMVMRVRVEHLDGEALSFRVAAVRNVLKILSVQMLGIGCFIALFTKRRQALHDFAVESVVLKNF